MHRTWCIFNAPLAPHISGPFFLSLSVFAALTVMCVSCCLSVAISLSLFLISFLCFLFSPLFGVSKQLPHGWGAGKERRARGTTCKWISRHCKVAAPAAPFAARVRVAMWQSKRFKENTHTHTAAHAKWNSWMSKAMPYHTIPIGGAWRERGAGA